MIQSIWQLPVDSGRLFRRNKRQSKALGFAGIGGYPLCLQSSAERTIEALLALACGYIFFLSSMFAGGRIEPCQIGLPEEGAKHELPQSGMQTCWGPLPF